MRSKIIGLAVLIAYILGANPESMAKDYKDNSTSISVGYNNNNFIATTSTDTLNIRRGYTADRSKTVKSYKLEHFGFIGGEFSRLKSTYDWIVCCRPTGNQMDGCSAKVVCPKYTREKK